MKLAKSIKFDNSDAKVYERSANEGEWAIPGGFIFSFLKQEHIVGKVKQAFANGFLCMPSFGHSTFVCIASLTEDDYKLIVNRLSQHLLENYGAPNMNAALEAANQEIKFMLEVCDNHELGTLLSLRRNLGENGIKEEFRSVLKPESCAEQKIWSVDENE